MMRKPIKANLRLPNTKEREEREDAGNLFGISVAEKRLHKRLNCPRGFAFLS